MLYNHTHYRFLLALVALISLLPKVIRFVNHSDDWLQPTDDIVNAEFKIKPNI
ncbi:hypothetical protein [Psychroserpens algicola]|uniref:Uncharacterized protein n=1 Tax=Psychroserpens algicola TaxID=1719034 RepID=A0ABT0H6Y8_9FLAO|nr:hypothetical protein [Psychroserpens algicola]MCK8480133.1 hypothetical protein [Psychroserpens algicola]